MIISACLVASNKQQSDEKSKKQTENSEIDNS